MDILKKLEVIFRDVFDDEDIVLTNEITANDIEDWDSSSNKFNCSNKKRISNKF